MLMNDQEFELLKEGKNCHEIFTFMRRLTPIFYRLEYDIHQKLAGEGFLTRRAILKKIDKQLHANIRQEVISYYKEKAI